MQHFPHSEGQAFTFSISQPGGITTLVQRFGETVPGGVRDMVLVEGSGWPHTHAPPVSAFKALFGNAQLSAAKFGKCGL